MVEPIRVVPYDPGWVDAYQNERAALGAALAPLPVRIEHVGSTSVPGLDAKPILDIQIVMQNADDAIRAITPLVKLGYECRGEATIPGRIYFRRGVPQDRHLHLFTTPENIEVKRHLVFRDYLRSHPQAAQEYAALKYELAERYRYDRLAYTDAKTEFVERTLAQARAEMNKGHDFHAPTSESEITP